MHSLVFQKMMERCYRKEFSLKNLFPENLEKTRTKLDNKNPKNNQKRNQNSESHIEQIDQRGK